MAAPQGIYFHGDNSNIEGSPVSRHREMLRFIEQVGCQSNQSEDEPILRAELLLDKRWWSDAPRPALVVIHHSALADWVSDPWRSLLDSIDDPFGLYILFVSKDGIQDSREFEAAQNKARDLLFCGFSVFRQPCQAQELFALGKRLSVAFSSSHLGFDEFDYACNPQRINHGATPFYIIAHDEVDAVALCVRVCEEFHDPQFVSPKDSRVLIAGNGREPQWQMLARIITEVDRVAHLSCEGGALPVHLYVGEVVGGRDQFNPLFRGFSALVASLVLALPDVAWHFVALELDASSPGPADAHNIMKIRRAYESLSPLDLSGFQPFDGWGLRELVRDHVRWSLAKEFGSYIADRIPRRLGVAIALDDEKPYAWFNACAAYRFGFRSFAVSTLADARLLLGRYASRFPAPNGGASLILEDLFLNFPDREKGHHFALLDGRDPGERLDQLPLLERADVRTLVTGNIDAGLDSQVIARNRAAISRGFYSHVAKPYAGMYGLWISAEFASKWSGGYCPGYVWPPVSSGVGDSGVEELTAAETLHKKEPRLHSAPGKLLFLADLMCERARRLEASGLGTVRRAATCAILAGDALELMGNLTPATCAEALRLKHVGEVAAECCFSGIQYNIEIGERISDVRKEAASLALHVGFGSRDIAALNAEMTAFLSLMKILREHGQFDECQRLQVEIRRLHNRLKIKSQSRGAYMLPLYVYTELILGSARNFILALLAWGGLFSAAFYYLASCGRGPVVGIGSGPLEQAFTAMTGANAFTSSGLCWWNSLTVLAVLVGLAHIGVFLAHMYMLVSRKD